MSQLYVITGQTATGKTRAALDLAKKVNGELINADSRQIYRGLDIVTGKDIPKGALFKIDTSIKIEQSYTIGYYTVEDIPLWLCDIIPPVVPFSAFEYQRTVIPVIHHILKKNKTPILVGGSVFYLQYLLFKPLGEESREENSILRQELQNASVEDLQNKLKKINSNVFESMNHSDKKNPRRLVRKIEILSSNPDYVFTEDFTSLHLTEKLSLFDPIPIDEVHILAYLWKNQNDARNGIQKRVEERIRLGAIEETRELHKKYTLNEYGFQTIGYPEIRNYLEGKFDLDHLIDLWTTKEVQYSKRQRTFLQKIPDATIKYPLANKD